MATFWAYMLLLSWATTMNKDIGLSKIAGAPIGGRVVLRGLAMANVASMRIFRFTIWRWTNADP